MPPHLSTKIIPQQTTQTICTLSTQSLPPPTLPSKASRTFPSGPTASFVFPTVGYKYRFFGQDAETAARVLGYKVGVVKQTETASIKAHGLNRGGPFCRGLSALYTKAMLEAAQDLGGGEDECGSVSNYLLCVVEKSIFGERKSKSGVEGGFDVRIGIVGVEISTRDVVYGEFDDNFLRSELEAVVVSLSPAELLLGDPLSKQTEKLLLAFAGPSSNARVERASRDCLTDGGALAEVMTLYENMCVDSPSDSMQGNELTEHKSQQMEVKEAMNLPDLVVEALALTILHLKGFGFERILCSAAGFPPQNNNVLIVTTSSNQVYAFDVEARQLEEWSVRNTFVLPKRFHEFPGEVIGLSFPPSARVESQRSCFVQTTTTPSPIPFW
ncbi:unnamed protein product [Vicia faba]|uniref:DNA mismatch repair protein MSH3 n=1 Tax=Vicia faba TaxID=3906 RepID=A0AAV0ZDA7_VICFA|nr:unnamed protein product [Vicia faba]